MVRRYNSGGCRIQATRAFNEFRAVDYVSAATILMRRSTFLQVLGFDLCFDPAYYEDIDLCLKISLLQLKIYYQPKSVVIHIENATSSDQRHNLGLDNIVAINKMKFNARWAGFLSDRAKQPMYLVPPSGPGFCFDTDAPRMAIYTPYELVPGGGERYILSIAAALASACEVTIVSHRPYSRLRPPHIGPGFQPGSIAGAVDGLAERARSGF